MNIRKCYFLNQITGIYKNKVLKFCELINKSNKSTQIKEKLKHFLKLICGKWWKTPLHLIYAYFYLYLFEDSSMIEFLYYFP